MSGGIYKIENLANSKVYIGSTISFNKRKKEHFSHLKKCSHPNKHLQNAFNKYGIDNFIFIELEILQLITSDKLLEKEQYYMDLLKSYDHKIGYNICKISNSCLGVKRSDETKNKISNSLKGPKNPMYGKNITSLVKEKDPEFNKGERNWNFGKFAGNHQCSKPILQYSKEGIFIKRWDSISSIKELESQISKISANLSHISACCKGKQKYCKGFIWKYEKTDTIEDI